MLADGLERLVLADGLEHSVPADGLEGLLEEPLAQFLALW